MSLARQRNVLMPRYRWTSRHLIRFDFIVCSLLNLRCGLCALVHTPMKDMQAHLEKLLTDAGECALIGKHETRRRQGKQTSQGSTEPTPYGACCLRP